MSRSEHGQEHYVRPLVLPSAASFGSPFDASVTLLSAAIILSFTTMEFFDYRRINTETSIVVDKSRGERLTIKMNITFPRVPCYRAFYLFGSIYLAPHYDRLETVLSLDVMDISGEAQRDLTHNIFKARLDPGGKTISSAVTGELRNEIDRVNEQRQEEGYCGSCYGGVEPEGGCCQTCEQVRQAYLGKGWSFTNPDSIEQVNLLLVFLFSKAEHTDFLPINS